MNIISNIRQMAGYGKRLNILTPDRKHRIHNSTERLTLDKSSIIPIKESGDFKFLTESDLFTIMEEFQQLDKTLSFHKDFINDTQMLRLMDLQETTKEWEAKMQVCRNEIYLLQKEYFNFWEALGGEKSKTEWKKIFSKVKTEKLKAITGVKNNTIRAAIEEVLSDRVTQSIKSRDRLSKHDKTYAITGRGETIKTTNDGI